MSGVLSSAGGELHFRLPKNLPSSVENLGTGQAKKVIGSVATSVPAPVSGHNKESGPTLPECPNSKKNKDKTGQAYEGQHDSKRAHINASQ